MNRRLLSYAISLSAIAWVGWQLTQHEVWSLDWPRVGGGWLLLVILLMPLNLGLEVAKWHRLNPTTSWNAAAREVGLSYAQSNWRCRRSRGFGARRTTSACKSRLRDFCRFPTVCHLSDGCLGTGQKGRVAPAFGLGICAVGLPALEPKNASLAAKSVALQRRGFPPNLPVDAVILLLSTLRYSIFSTQLFLSFKAVDLRVPVTDIPLIFLGNTVVPSAALGELGVREAVTLAVLSPEGTEVASAVIAAFFVWFINLLVPAMAGIFLKTNPA
jgi:hypothetical protein